MHEGESGYNVLVCMEERVITCGEEFHLILVDSACQSADQVAHTAGAPLEKGGRVYPLGGTPWSARWTSFQKNGFSLQDHRSGSCALTIYQKQRGVVVVL